MAKTILGLCCSLAAVQAAATGDPAARLAGGIRAYQQKDYASAAAVLGPVRARLPKLADYAAYYEAAARVESGSFDRIEQALAPAHRTDVASPLSGAAWILEARARAGAAAPQDAVRLLREHYAELPQPDGDLALAQGYEAAADLPHAADFYQRVYYGYPSTDAASRAGAALLKMKQSMGNAYPQALAKQKLDRANLLMQSANYAQARVEFESIAPELTGADAALARVRAAAADYLGGSPGACASLRSLDLPQSEADAERLYYTAECARRSGNDDSALSMLDTLSRRYPKSPWRLRALVSAANRFLVQHRPDEYLPLYRAAYENFPAEPAAGACHWKVAFNSWFERSQDAEDLLREHLRYYANHPTAAAALYFLGRLNEERDDPAAARAFYDKLNARYPNYYYGILARRRLDDSRIAAAQASERELQFLAGIGFPDAPRLELEPTHVTTLRVERAKLLRAAGLDDLASAELRFGALHDGRPQLLAMELARNAPAPFQGLRAMKRYCGDYLGMPLDATPGEFWRLLFPMPWRTDIAAHARANSVDPFLVAALIRQESEFNPGAISGAGAYGLMQLRPGTAKIAARRRVSTRQLQQAATNLKLGTTVLRGMLNSNGGKLEETLASYNAGPNRVKEWITWGQFHEPAEFVESIPFTETREYVQAVTRNAELYRRIYAGVPETAARAAAKSARKTPARRTARKRA